MKAFRYLAVVLVLALALPAFAQKQHNKGQKRPDKKEWLAKMKEFKQEFLTRELQLTAKQQKEFLPLYDKMQMERHNAEKNLHKSEEAIEKKGDKVTDAEYDKVIEAQYNLDQQLNAIDKKYIAQFRKVLTRKQVFKLRKAEMNFKRTLMEQRNCPPPPPRQK